MAADGGSRQTILIVDDSSDDIEITKMALAEAGCPLEVLVAGSGEAAWALLQAAEELPTVIMLDMKTPGMSGLDTLRRIRADAGLKHLPVIMVTASSREADRLDAYESGADGFLYKEIDLDAFTRELAALLPRLLGAVPHA